MQPIQGVISGRLNRMDTKATKPTRSAPRVTMLCQCSMTFKGVELIPLDGVIIRNNKEIKIKEKQ